ncbi:MAG: NTP transferase domain-containing protein [Rhodospirillales bacterium]|nr:NTP transferase domain-containing protein [Rhodospirillales bacterium]
MRVAMLGAGVGRRLEQPDLPPKVLLRFGGETLLARHVHILRACGVARIDLAVGYRAEEIDEEIARIGAGDMVMTYLNPDYERGAIVSLWTLGQSFASGEPVIFMDGDVLYDHRMMRRLIDSTEANCFLMDRATEEGDDPVKLCMRDGRLVDFHKRPQLAYDWWGEWIGFARFAPATAARIAAAAAAYVEAGRLDEIYEEAFRDVILSVPPGSFGVEDVTGLPWVEIDFPEDLAKAEREIFPVLDEA